MKDKKIFIIIGIALVIGAVAAFVWYKNRQKKKEKEAAEANKNTDTVTPTGTVTDDKLAKILGISNTIMLLISSFLTITTNSAGDWIVKVSATSPVMPNHEWTIKKNKVDEVLND